MMKSFEKYKLNVKEKNNMENILSGCKINKDLLIAEEYLNKEHNIILYDLKSEKKILNISFHKNYITSFHICKKPLFIDDKEITFPNDSFYFLSSSLDKKFALHQISFNNSTNEYSNYTLISQCKPTHDEINSVIQIENGQILITARDQSLILFSNKIKNGNFEKLFEIKQPWPMAPEHLLEIRKNLIGVSWNYDDEEADESYTEEMEKNNHSKDGIYIYLIDNNKIIEKKNFVSLFFLMDQYSFIVMEDKLILKRNNEIFVYNLDNHELNFKFQENNNFDMYQFNKKYFIVFYKDDTKAIIKLYNINSMKNEQLFEFQAKSKIGKIFPISNNEIVFDNFIATIEKV